MKTTALICSGQENLFPGSKLVQVKEILLYTFHQYVFYLVDRFRRYPTLFFKSIDKRKQIAVKKEVAWVNYCISVMETCIRTIDSHKACGTMEYINIRQFVDFLVRKRKRDAVMLGVEVVVNVNEEVHIYTSRALLEIVISNILINAIQYSDDKKKKKYVYIDAIDTWELTYISIKDNGIGIPNEELNNIYTVFYQISNASPGIGVGLYLAKKAIEKIEGSIDVISSAGLGTEFLVQFPSATTVLQSIQGKGNEINREL